MPRSRDFIRALRVAGQIRSFSIGDPTLHGLTKTEPPASPVVVLPVVVSPDRFDGR
jgi:hypothetical protein